METKRKVNLKYNKRSREIKEMEKIIYNLLNPISSSNRIYKNPFNIVERLWYFGINWKEK